MRYKIHLPRPAHSLYSFLPRRRELLETSRASRVATTRNPVCVAGNLENGMSQTRKKTSGAAADVSQRKERRDRRE